MFNDYLDYPWLNEGKCYKQLPSFVDPTNLLTDEVDSIKAFTLSTVDKNSTAILGDWRLINTGPLNFLYSDRPIPVNLAYTDANLLTGGTMGEPVGDLDWFPTQKARWSEALEAITLESELQGFGGEPAVKNHGTVPTAYTLSQNYPNPFNPTTIIDFDVPQRTFISMKIYDVLGRDVAQLVNEVKQPGRYSVRFDGTNLLSEVYIYSITVGTFHQGKKMVLMK